MDLPSLLTSAKRCLASPTYGMTSKRTSNGNGNRNGKPMSQKRDMGHPDFVAVGLFAKVDGFYAQEFGGLA
jgi:hypothetical protein